MKLRGIITPLVTPLNENYLLDVASLRKIIEHIIKGGVSAVFPLGTTGEFCSFKVAMQKEIIQEVCAAVRGRIPVLIGISATCLSDSLVLAEIAKKSGADALVATLPYYYKLSQEEISHYYKLLADSVSLPLYLYNMPGQTKIHIEPETVLSLSKHPNIIGFKDSSGDMEYFAKVTKLFKNIDFDLFVGPEEKLTESLILGAHGGVNGGSNLFPKWYVSLYDAYQNGDMDQVESLQNKIQKLSEEVYHLNDNPNSYLQGIKAAMSIHGLCQATLAPPLQGLSSNLKMELKEKLNKLF
jgi:4-hydroxy-tetrahydrodipicolinate synthase